MIDLSLLRFAELRKLRALVQRGVTLEESLMLPCPVVELGYRWKALLEGLPELRGVGDAVEVHNGMPDIVKLLVSLIEGDNEVIPGIDAFRAGILYRLFVVRNGLLY